MPDFAGIFLVGLAFCTVFKRLPPHKTHCRLERLGRRSAGPQDWSHPARLKSRHRPRRLGIRIAAKVSHPILSHRVRVFLARRAAGPGLGEENVGKVRQSTHCPWVCPLSQVFERIECFFLGKHQLTGCAGTRMESLHQLNLTGITLLSGRRTVRSR
jgi:hypothetical protein